MIINDKVLQQSEKIIFALRELYLSKKFSPYRMSKFEEYDLYADNKDFLVSDNVITFNDIDPNIGIVINQDAYNENPDVFTDKDGKETVIGFRRINQMYPTNNTIAITLPVDDNITEVGTYKLFIPANTVYGYLDKSVVYAEDINIEWTITTASGIYGIFAGKNEKVNVFTIDGKAVLKNADASDLKQLAPGKLYIINGKKFVVK